MQPLQYTAELLMAYKTYIVLIERFGIKIYKNISASFIAINVTKHDLPQTLPQLLCFYYLIKNIYSAKIFNYQNSGISIVSLITAA